MRLILLLACMLVLFKVRAEDSLAARLQLIPELDRKRIELLFEYLFWDGQFAYTFLGSKPMSTVAHHRKSLLYGLMHPSLSHLIKLYWKSWEKYSHLFPLKGFKLFAHQHNGWLEIYLINEKLAKEMICKNKTLFQAKLNIHEPEKILEKILRSQKVCKEGLNNSQALYGLLLGYGYENSINFESFYTSNKVLAPPVLKKQEMFPFKIPLPTFASFASSETAKLNTNYSQDREKIMHCYSGSTNLLICKVLSLQ